MQTRGWTKEEVNQLRSLYPSTISFHDLLDRFPSRSPNSIRLMASRLGLKRPSILSGIKKVVETETLSIGGGGMLVKCSHCSGWIKASIEKVSMRCIVVCDHCGGVNLLID